MFVLDKDFFIRKRKILLTTKGREKVKNFRITGTKIPKFFDLDNTLFKVWAEFNSFYGEKVDLKEKKNYLEKVEDKLREFVNEKTNLKFKGYSSSYYLNVFNNKLFGGVPDGESYNGDKKVDSILEIKTPHQDNDLSEKKLISYLLQLGLYLYLRDLDTGYLCVANLGKSKSWKNKETNLNLFLNKPEEAETIPFLKAEKRQNVLFSKFEELNNLSFNFEILESKRYVNNKQEVYLLKVKINMEEYSKIIKGCEIWLGKYSFESPEIIPEKDCTEVIWRKI